MKKTITASGLYNAIDIQTVKSGMWLEWFWLKVFVGKCVSFVDFSEYFGFSSSIVCLKENQACHGPSNQHPIPIIFIGVNVFEQIHRRSSFSQTTSLSSRLSTLPHLSAKNMIKFYDAIGALIFLNDIFTVPVPVPAPVPAPIPPLWFPHSDHHSSY